MILRMAGDVTDITPIVEAIIKLVVAFVCVMVIPCLKQKFSQTQLDNALIWIKIAVQAAEQLYASTQGAEKKAYVVKYMKDKGIKINTSDLDGMIEAAVLELHNQLYGTSKTETSTETKEG